MLIDTHIHIYDPEFGDFAWPQPGSKYHRLFDLDAFSQAHGGLVDQAVVIGCSNELELNQALLQTCAKDSRAAAYIAQLDPAAPDFVRNCQLLAKEKKYRGFRFAARQGLEKAAQASIAKAGRGQVVEILGNWQEISQLLDFVASQPGMTFVIEHFGGFLFDGGPLPAAYIRFLYDFAALPHVYMKLSGILTLARATPKPDRLSFYYAAFATATAAFTAKRCLFGSDWPVMAGSYTTALDLTKGFCQTLSGAAAEAILGKTAATVYKLET